MANGCKQYVKVWFVDTRDKAKAKMPEASAVIGKGGKNDGPGKSGTKFG